MSTFAMDLKLDDFKSEADRLFNRNRLVNLGLPAAVLAYLIYVFFVFDVPSLTERVNWEYGKTLVSDSYSDKTQIARDNRNGQVSAAKPLRASARVPNPMFRP